MSKTPFNKLPIYKAIRGSKLSKRAQDEVLRKLKKIYNAQDASYFTNDITKLEGAFNWNDTTEGYGYWAQMHRDSGL